MADGNHHQTIDFAAIPVAQIAETRRCFPNCALSYEVLFTVQEVQSVAVLAAVCATAGLAIGAMRCGPNGVAHCVLLDGGGADLDALAKALRAVTGVRLDHWTTVVQF